jgi:DNA-binding transcriptional regulator YdaS (Cro superfamily)
MLTEAEVIARLQSAVVAAGGQRAFAKANGFTVAYVNDVLHGRRALADRIIATVGVERSVIRKVVYREKGVAPPA